MVLAWLDRWHLEFDLDWIPANASEVDTVRESKIEEYFGAMVKTVLQGRVAKQTDGGGIPDRIAIVPLLPMEWVELKSEGKPLQPLQKEWQAWLIERGFRWAKLDSKSDVDQWIAKRRMEQQREQSR